MPGGEVTEDESYSQAAKREIKEELGVEVKIVKELGIRSFVEDEVEMTYVWFLAQITDGQPDFLEKEIHDDLQYFDWKALNKRDDLSANLQNLVSAYLNGEIANISGKW